MRKKITSLLLAITLLLQIFIPPKLMIAEGEESLPQGSYVQVGTINANSYDAKIMSELNRITARSRKRRSAEPGVSLFGAGPYFKENNEPNDENKPKYYGNISVDFKLSGLDGNKFQWNEIFGVDEAGNPKPAQIIFTQSDDETGNETGVEYILKVTETGKYTWQDKEGNPTKLPLFSKGLKPYNYEVRVDEDVADNIKLLTARMTGTEGSSPTFSPENADGEIIANITLELGLQQVASTKFKSEWHTGVAETARPDMKANFTFDDNGDGMSPVSVELPKNDNETKIIRDWEDSFEPDLVIADYLYNKPDVKLKDTNGNGLTFEEADGVKTVTAGNHKFKYDFNYDVIKGGKLTMTEILPVTFDANGGKFDSITGAGADQKIVKEVDYDGTLTDKAEAPKKDLETFKGWATDKDGKNPATDADFKNITKAKTFYAIWEDNDLVAEELEVKESYKDGNGYVNDFIPLFGKITEKIKIKNSQGSLDPLKTDDKVEILNDQDIAVYDNSLKDYLYEKLKEKDNPNDEPTRIEEVKVRVTLKSGKVVEDYVRIKVVKNIYEAKTLTEKPYYVPDTYKKVTLDPTTKATDPQKTYYYVNPNAKVVIPGNDPTGVDDNLFVGWKIKNDTSGQVFDLKERHKFAGETTIEAQYTTDVIPQDGTEKPDTVPDDFVKVTFVPTDKATDETKADKIFWVNPKKDVTIPVKNPVGKQYYTFKEWKIGDVKTGETYKVGTQKKFTDVNGTTITATYTESDNIIPFDPTNTSDPKIVRPKGYVKVTFEAEDGIKLKEQKAYYVKENAGIKLGNAEIVKPGVKAETGYTVKVDNNKKPEWTPDDTTEIKDQDIVVKIKSKKLDDVIPKTKDDESEKPAGYVEVKFSTEANGKIKGTDKTEKIVYVNPNVGVALDGVAPKVTPNTGYDFAGWDTQITKPIQYTKGGIIKALYNKKGNVIPQEKADESDKPAGYLTVTFKEGDHGTLEGKTVYYVKPNEDVTVPAPTVKPKVGYKFDKWDQVLTQKFTKDTTITAGYTKHKDIIPSKKDDGTPNQKPEGYVTVTFDKGENAKEIKGKTVYYVNPEAGKTLADITKPKITAEVGYKQKEGADAWDKVDTTAIAGPDDIVVTAKYDKIPDVVPEKDNSGTTNEKPDGYHTVTFSTETNGKIKDTDKTEKVVYVNPNKAVILKDSAPEVKANTGFEFARWDTSIERAIKYNDNDTIKALYNPIGAVIPKENDETKKPDGYVTVTFEKGTNGKSITGTTVYYVDPNKKVNLPAPTVTPNTGWKQKDGEGAWDQKLTQTFKNDTKITAQYEQLADIISQQNKDGTDKPDGYVTVTFEKGEHGKLEGQTVYYVNPEAGKTLGGITKPKVIADIGYQQKEGKDAWDKADDISISGTDDIVVTAKYKELANVIEKTSESQVKPDGYVTVEFIAGDNGSLEGGNKTYFVNPTKGITVGSTDLPKPTPQPAEKYVFDKWYEAIDDNPITTDKKFVATFTHGKVTITYEADDKTAGEVPLASSHDVGTHIPLAGGNDLKKDNYHLNGWKIGEIIYAPGAEFEIKDNITAKAVWNPDLYTVEFNTQGGTFIATQKVPYNTKIVGLQNPEKEGYLFTGWTVDGNPFDPATDIVTKDITLVAHYSKDVIPAKPDGSKPDGTPANYVKVSFDPTANGSLEGTRIFYVNPEKAVTIPVKNPVGKLYFSFDKWKIGADASGAEYDPSTPKKFTEETTITATYKEAETIMPYDPSATDPKQRPDGYIRVTFKAEEGLKLKEQKAYYVKKNAKDEHGQPITLANPSLAKPRVTAETGYEVLVDNQGNPVWDPADTTKIGTEDIVVTIKAKKLEDVIPKTKNNDSEKPAGYVVVKFVAGENGKLTENNQDIAEKVYYVNPNKYVALTPPTPVGDNGYVFSTWSLDTTNYLKYTDAETIITARFNSKNSVVPKTKTDDSEKPAGFVKVTYQLEQVDGKDAGSFDNGEVTTYFVKKNEFLTIPQPKVTPKTGYKFDKWNPDPTTSRDYNEAETFIKGTFKKIPDIIPAKDINNKDNLKPTGYVTVTFDKGEYAKEITGQTVYYVNPEAGKTLADITKPTVTAEVGHKFTGWDTKDDFEIKSDKTVKAEYSGDADVIPKEKPDGGENDKPAGYITVKFITTENGKIKGTDKTEKVVYVNPNKAVVLKDAAPEVIGIDGNNFVGWDITINKPIKYEDNDVITAQYNKSPIQGADNKVKIVDGGLATYPTVTTVGTKLSLDDYKQLVEAQAGSTVEVNGINTPADVTKEGFTQAILDVTLNGVKTQAKVLVYVKEPCPSCPNPNYPPLPNPGEKPEDKPGEKPEDKPGEKPEDKPGEKPEDKPGEKPEDKPGEKPGEQPGEKPEDKPGEKPGEKPDDKPAKPDDKPDKPSSGKSPKKTGTNIITDVRNFLSPKTGIVSNYELYIGLMAASSVGLFFTREKKNKDEE